MRTLLILGPLRLVGATGEVALGGEKPRKLLAALALHAGETISPGRLIDIIWGPEPPRCATQNLQTYIWSLRRALEQAGGCGVFIQTQPGGYVLQAEPGALDWDRFGSLSLTAAECMRSDPATAGSLLREALDLWRDRPLADIADAMPALGARIAALEEARLTALEQRVDADLAAGRSREVIGELAELAAAHPLREQFRAQLMLALYRSGRRAEALSAFRDLRAELREELGIDPTAELAALHEGILRGDPGLSAPEAGPASTASAAVHMPRQLPARPRGFTGRRGSLRWLEALLTAGQRPADAAVITGPPGVGKTALALLWSHRIQDRFPDGTLFADLRGSHPFATPAVPGEVLESFLRALSGPVAIPAQQDGRAALLRSVLADKSVLIVLDDAVGPSQVRPLLPGSPGCLTVITSRSRLSGLVARDGAIRIVLGPLGERDAVALLRQIAAPRRVDAEPAAAAEVARLCGGLPLALRIAAERAAGYPSSSLAGLADQLREEHDRLAVLATADDDTAVRAAFSWSYRRLHAHATRMFRLLGLVPGPTFGPAAAAALAGVSVARARRSLDALTGVNLVEDMGDGRYRLHDLLRLYAAECAEAEESAQARAAAIRRLLTWYIHAADTADRILSPRRRHLELEAAEPCCRPPAFESYERALAWCDTEHVNLAAATRLAAIAGQHAIAWRLPVALWSYYMLRKPWDEWIGACQAGLASAQQARDRVGEAQLLSSLGICHGDRRQHGEAISCFQQALEIARELGDQRGEAASLSNLAQVHCWQRRFGPALHCCRQALPILRAIGDTRTEASTLKNMGDVCRKMGRFSEALGYLRQALTNCREIGDRYGEAEALHRIGDVNRRLARLDDAHAFLSQALEIRREVGDRPGEAATLSRIGDLGRAAGRFGQARQAWRQALAIYHELGDPRADHVRTLLESLHA
ncbi:MAG TPA: BTAD domain-containing putative transcriptional regulator [Streptosporangiaceae bacterium]|nr:BTAD domain-containing putative transcriptional regulator [Streptosporangiaceae bacterium]